MSFCFEGNTLSGSHFGNINALSLALGFQEPPSFLSRSSSATKEGSRGRKRPTDSAIARLLHQSRKIRPLCVAPVYPRAAPSRPRSDLVSPTERFCHFKIYRGGASRNFRPVDTRDRSPLLLILLLSASSSRGTARDKRGFTLTGQTAPLSQTETPLHAQIIHTGRVHR